MAQTAAPLDPNLPVREILSLVPEARPILASSGLDTCCGGAHPLAEACAAHGIDVGAVVTRIEEARRLSRVSARPARAPETPACGTSRFSPRFLIGSIAVTLTLGAGSGMFYLWRIGAGADVPFSHRQIHAHSQVLGFAALFLMGIAYHALPRMLGARPVSERTQKLVFWSMLGGVLLRNLGQPFAFFAFGRALSLLSGLLEAAAGVGFVLYVLTAANEARRNDAERRDPLPPFLVTGAVFFLLALAFDVMQGAWIAGKRDATLPAALNEPFYFVALFGFLLAFIFGFAGRMLPAFLGTAPLSARAILATRALQTTGVLLAVAAYAPVVSPAAQSALKDAGLSLVSLAALVYVASSGVLARSRRLAAPAIPGSPQVAIRVAFSSLVLWALLNLSGVAVARATRFPAQNPWWMDAARHLYTVGFLTLLIVGISFRILPVFSGKPLHSPSMARVTYGLVALGAAMRLLQYPGAFVPFLYQVGSFMGVPVVLALVLFALNLVRTVRPRAARPVLYAATLPSRG